MCAADEYTIPLYFPYYLFMDEEKNVPIGSGTYTLWYDNPYIKPDNYVF
jgi:hypothetical protein